MSRRTREASRRIRLQKLLEENNTKSPDILSAVVNAKTKAEAVTAADIFLNATGIKPKFSFDEWKQRVKIPVELYFQFHKRKELISFIRQLRRDIPSIEVTT